VDSVLLMLVLMLKDDPNKVLDNGDEGIQVAIFHYFKLCHFKLEHLKTNYLPLWLAYLTWLIMKIHIAFVARQYIKDPVI
jgi:hypothetical protein